MLRKPTRGCLLLLACIAFGITASAAQETPAANVKAHLTIMGFTLGKSGLPEVVSKLGQSAIRKCSRDEEASNEVCYVSTNTDQTRVVFQAGFSGGWKTLDGYKVIANSVKLVCYSGCPRTNQVTSDVHTEGGLRLGLTRRQVVTLLGPPRQVRGNRLIFQWQSRQAMTKEQIAAVGKTFEKSPVTDPYYDVQDSIEVTLSGSQVVAFETHHIVTY